MLKRLSNNINIETEQIKMLLLDGKTIDQISKEIGKSVQSIYKVINKNGWKNLITNKRKEIIKLIHAGLSNDEIEDQLCVSKTTIYRVRKTTNVKNKKKKQHKSLTKWTEGIFFEIQSMAKKYHCILSRKGIDIDKGDIESILLDLMIHTDQKNIENKDAYFRKYAPLKVKDLARKNIVRGTQSLYHDNSGEEIYYTTVHPEMILMLNERVL